MRVFPLSALGAALFAAVIGLAPAVLLERAVDGNSALRLWTCSGRLFGSGRCWAFLGRASESTLLGELSFEWKVIQEGGPHISVKHDGAPFVEVRPTLAGWRVSGVGWASRRLPVEALPQVIGVARPAGRLKLSIPQIDCSWLGKGCSGRVLVELHDLVAGRREAFPVGAFRLELGLGSDSGTTGDLRTISGAVGAEGRFSRTPSGQFQGAGRIRLGPGTTAEAVDFLATFSERESADTFRFAIRQ